MQALAGCWKAPTESSLIVGDVYISLGEIRQAGVRTVAQGHLTPTVYTDDGTLENALINVALV